MADRIRSESARRRRETEVVEEAARVSETGFKPVPGLLPKWKEIDPISFIEQCLGHADEVTLTITGSGYSVSYLGVSSSASGGQPHLRPSPDLITDYQAFQSLNPNLKLHSY